MPAISQADLSRLAGVSRTTVNKAVKAKPPRLALEADGSIDTDLPINAAQLKAWRSGVKGPQHKAAPVTPPPKKPSKPPASPPPEDADDEDDSEEGLTLVLESAAEKLKLTKAKRKDTEAQTVSRELAQAKHKGLHIPREEVARELSIFNAKIKTNFFDMPRRITDQVIALAKSSTRDEVLAYLEREIGSALAAALP